MRTRIEKTVMLKKLTRELLAAGVPLARDVIRIDNSGLYIPLVNETQEQEYRDTINSVLEAHDGIDDEMERLNQIPGWATWTEAQALEWFTTHIDNLTIPADVKTLLKAYGRMLLILRDKVMK